MKTMATITLDTDLMIEVRIRKINLSALVNDFLRNYLGLVKNDTIAKTDDLSKIDVEKARLMDEVRKLEKQKQDALKKFDKSKVVIKC